MIGGVSAALGSSVIFLGLAVAALWGASDFMGGLAARRAPALVVVAIAHGFSTVLLFALASAVHAHSPSSKLVMWAVLTGLSGGLALIVFYRALASGKMGIAAALAGVLTAVVPVAFSWITEGRPKATQALGFLIALLAIYLIAAQPRGRFAPRNLGLSILAGFGFGLFLIFSKFASQGAILWPLAISRLTSTTLCMSLLAGATLLRRHSGPDSSWRTGSRWQQVGPILLLAAGAGVLEATGNMLYMQATLVGRLDVSAVLSSLYPAGTILLAMWLLKERASRRNALGMILALASVVMISL